MYKLMFVDLDGTLLRDDKTVSQYDIEAIHLARKSGVRVMIATGRPTVGADKYLADIGFQEGDFLISNNGATILSLPDLEIKDLKTISVSEHRSIDAFLREQGLEHYSFDTTYCLSERLHEYTEWEQKANGIEVKLVDFSKMEDSIQLLKIMAFGSPPAIEAAMQAVPDNIRQNYAVVRSADILLEFLHPSATKGNAVKTIANWLRVKREDVICIGDSGNDLDMLAYAGLGIAMENAKPDVHAAADKITGSNEESGIAQAIKKYVLTRAGEPEA